MELKMKILVESVPSDERSDIQKFLDLDLTRIDLDHDDFTIWNALPWTTDYGFESVIGAVAKYVIETESVGGGLTVDALIDYCWYSAGNAPDLEEPIKGGAVKFKDWSGFPKGTLQVFLQLLRRLGENNDYLEEAIQLRECQLYVESLILSKRI